MQEPNAAKPQAPQQAEQQTPAPPPPPADTPPPPQASSAESPLRRAAVLLRALQEAQEAGGAEAAEAGKDEAQTAAREEIAALLANMHEADIADLLERMPPDERALLWAQLDSGQIASVLPEVSESLCEYLVENTEAQIMVDALRQMDADDVAGLMRELPKNDAARLMRLANLAGNPDVRASLSFADNTVGALMDYQPVLARATESVREIRRRLQGMGELPSHCDKLFVVDEWERLTGVLPLKRVLLTPSDARAESVMVAENLHTFEPDDDAEEAAGAFERYDLISAPVVDGKQKIVGRITIDEILDHVQSKRDLGMLNSAGVLEDEDLFASLGRRFGNRWRWLFVNLVAAFVISRVVGLFEGAIAQLVALAALMPVVAGMSGNIGNQTATLTIRALALGKISGENWRIVMRNEALLSVVNGLVWGGLVGAFAYLLYGRWDLSAVLVCAMTLCFLCGALAGFAVPALMQKIGRDPAVGATVVISAITDTLGFFVFLGMGALFLI